MKKYIKKYIVKLETDSEYTVRRFEEKLGNDLCLSFSLPGYESGAGWKRFDEKYRGRYKEYS